MSLQVLEICGETNCGVYVSEVIDMDCAVKVPHDLIIGAGSGQVPQFEKGYILFFGRAVELAMKVLNVLHLQDVDMGRGHELRRFISSSGFQVEELHQVLEVVKGRVDSFISPVC